MCCFFFSRQQTSAETGSQELWGRRCSINYSAAFQSFSLADTHTHISKHSPLSLLTHIFSHLRTQLPNSCLIHKEKQEESGRLPLRYASMTHTHTHAYTVSHFRITTTHSRVFYSPIKQPQNFLYSHLKLQQTHKRQIEL